MSERSRRQPEFLIHGATGILVFRLFVRDSILLEETFSSSAGRSASPPDKNSPRERSIDGASYRCQRIFPASLPTVGLYFNFDSASSVASVILSFSRLTSNVEVFLISRT